MKKVSQIVSAAFLFTLVLSSIGVGRASALEPSPVWELKLTADDPVPAAEFGRSVAMLSAYRVRNRDGKW